MIPTEKLYDKNGVIGFVKRKDGYWFIQENGQHISCDAKTGEQVFLTVKTLFVSKRTPHFAECVKWMRVALKHRMVGVLYNMAKVITGNDRT